MFKGLKVPAVQAKRAILVCYAMLFALGCVYVPWNIRLPSGSTVRFKRGFLWSPPQGYRTLPPLPDKKIFDMYLEETNAALKAAKIRDWKSVVRTSEIAKSLSAAVEQDNDNRLKAWEEYERTTLVINWGDLFLELVALTAVCVAALLVVTQQPKSSFVHRLPV